MVAALSWINAIVLDSSTTVTTIEGGNSLMTHKTYADGKDEPVSKMETAFH